MFAAPERATLAAVQLQVYCTVIVATALPAVASQPLLAQYDDVQRRLRRLEATAARPRGPQEGQNSNAVRGPIESVPLAALPAIHLTHAPQASLRSVTLLNEPLATILSFLEAKSSSPHAMRLAIFTAEQTSTGKPSGELGQEAQNAESSHASELRDNTRRIFNSGAEGRAKDRRNRSRSRVEGRVGNSHQLAGGADRWHGANPPIRWNPGATNREGDIPRCACIDRCFARRPVRCPSDSARLGEPQAATGSAKPLAHSRPQTSSLSCGASVGSSDPRLSAWEARSAPVSDRWTGSGAGGSLFRCA